MNDETPRRFRVIDTGIRGGRANIAFDQALIAARQERGIPDTIRFLRFRPSALIGMHQMLSHEVRVDHCRRRGIEIGRRITGGGGLYLDEGQIGWELVFERGSLGMRTLDEATRHICEAAALGIRKLGIPAQYRPRNDIEVDGRKISGTGGFFDGDTLFYQGTLLIDFDPAEMIAALKIPAEKLSKRELDSARQRVVSLRDLLGERLPDLPTIYRALLDGFAESLGIVPEWGAISRFEEALADRLHREEFGTDAFVEMLDAPEVDDGIVSATLTKRGGAVRADIRLEGPTRNRIREALITGDFFVTPPRVVLDLEASLRGREVGEVGAVIDEFFAHTHVEFLNLGPDDIRETVEAALHQLSFVAAGRRLRGRLVGASSGGAPTVVFLHDALGCVRLWRDVPERIAAATGRRALIYDRWGSGDSEPLEPPFSRRYLLDEALSSLPEVMRATGVQRPILIGHSDGAAIALAYAGVFPAEVEAVVAIAPHLSCEERTRIAVADQITDFEHGDLKARLMRYHGAKTERLFRRLVEVWTAEGVTSWGLEAYLARIRCPILAIQGTDDEFFSKAQMEALSALCVRAPLKTISLPDCGHAPHHQRPKPLIGVITEFIEVLRQRDREPEVAASGCAGSAVSDSNNTAHHSGRAV
jgi:lipoate---protein ligase